MVRDVFDEASVGGLKGWMGIGHGMFRGGYFDHGQAIL